MTGFCWRALIVAALLCGPAQIAAAAKFDDSGILITAIRPDQSGYTIYGYTALPFTDIRQRSVDPVTGPKRTSDAKGKFSFDRVDLFCRPGFATTTSGLVTNSGTLGIVPSGCGTDPSTGSFRRELTCRQPSDYFAIDGALACVPRCLPNETALLGRVNTRRISDDRIFYGVTEGGHRLDLTYTLQPRWDGDGIVFPLRGSPTEFYQEGWIICSSPIVP